MKHTYELMLMIAKFLYGELDAGGLSFDFPARLSGVFDEFRVENENLCDYLEDELPELCAAFDLHGIGDDGTLDAGQFRAKVLEVYQKPCPCGQHHNEFRNHQPSGRWFLDARM